MEVVEDVLGELGRRHPDDVDDEEDENSEGYPLRSGSWVRRGSGSPGLGRRRRHDRFKPEAAASHGQIFGLDQDFRTLELALNLDRTSSHPVGEKQILRNGRRHNFFSLVSF